MLLCFILFSVQPAQLEARLYDDDEAVNSQNTSYRLDQSRPNSETNFSALGLQEASWALCSARHLSEITIERFYPLNETYRPMRHVKQHFVIRTSCPIYILPTKLKVIIYSTNVSNITVTLA